MLLVGFGLLIAGASRVALQARPPRLLRILQDTLHTTGQVGVRASIFLLALLVLPRGPMRASSSSSVRSQRGIVVGLALNSPEGKIVGMRLEGIGFGFLVPVYFVVTGMNFDLDSLLTTEGLLLRSAVPRVAPRPRVARRRFSGCASSVAAPNRESRALRRHRAAAHRRDRRHRPRSVATSRTRSPRR